VLDLSLPDLSGYEMLQRMAETDEVSFPPVIVYTGRSLTRDEEQRLRRFSRSIIIKDVRSPERLLDEVTLFLHQVESKLPLERQRMLREARDRESAFEGRRILIVEDSSRVARKWRSHATAGKPWRCSGAARWLPARLSTSCSWIS
jgi:DNA-binding response OmpR family regulator